MKRHIRVAALCLGINSAFFSAGAIAQASPAPQACRVDEISRPEVESRFKKEMQSLLSADLKAKKLADDALFKSVGPPPSAEGSRLVDGASFTDVLAIAVENEFLKEGNGQTSIQITPFAWKAAFDPDIVNDPDRYNTTGNRWARRFALTFATGGTGEKFDRTGDGVVDDPLKAGDFNDIQTWELKYRVFGSDDWKESPEKLVEAAGDPAPSALEYAALNLGMASAGVVDPGNPQCVKESLFVIYLKSAGAQASLLRLAQVKREQNAALNSVFKKISNGWRGSIVAGTTQQEPDFGQDKWSAGFRATWGGDARSVNLNADYSEAKGRETLPDPNSWKLGAEYVTYLWKGKLGKKGAKAAFSAVWEMFDDIPTATHKDIGKVGLRIEFPIAGSEFVKIPISVIWANHEDVLTDADSVRAHIGFTVDFGDALKKQKPAK
jgi:hypothetical protein